MSSSHPAVSGVFEGLSFFLLQKIPLRSTFRETIQSNGGRVVSLERQAQYIIADHARKDAPVDSISYTFIEAALRDGALPDLDAHRARKSSARVGRPSGPVGVAKSTRTPFTPQDDKILLEWIEECRENGRALKGNEIYKELEAQYPHHTYQSWQARYTKNLQHRSPAVAATSVAQASAPSVSVPAVPPPTPPTAPDDVQDTVNVSAQMDESPDEDTEKEFTAEDFANLMGAAEHIEHIPSENWDDAWDDFAQNNPTHSAEDWRNYYLREVLPAWSKQEEESAKESDGDGAGVADEEGGEQVKAPTGRDASESGASEPHDDDVDSRPKRKFRVPQQFSPNGRQSGAQKRQLEQPQLTQDASKRQKSGCSGSAVAESSRAAQDSEIRLDDIAASLDEQPIPGSSSEPGKHPLAYVLIQEPGDALTEANLASQQAQHQAQLLNRPNLPVEDDDVQSQAEFIDSLRQTLPPPDDPRFALLSHQAQRPLVKEGVLGNASRNEIVPESSLGQRMTNGKHDADAAFRSSGKRVQPIERTSKRVELKSTRRTSGGAHALPDSVEESMAFDTQIAYPDLNSQIPNTTRKQAESKGRLLSQQELKKSSAATLPSNQLQSPRDTEERARSAQKLFPEGDDLSVAEEVLAEIQDDQDEIDLSMPEPACGFQYSSSPVKSDLHGKSATQSYGNMIRSMPKNHELRCDTSFPSSPPSTPGLFVSDERSKNPRSLRTPNALDTQDILDAETQALDFAIPAPPDSEFESSNTTPSAEPSHAPPHDMYNSPTSAQPAQFDLREQDDGPDDVDTYIETMLLRGYKEQDIIDAIKCTSASPDLADLILVEKRLGHGLPDVAGVWSEEEDRALEGADAVALRALDAKHTWRGCQARLKFLALYREVDDEEM